MEAFQVALDRYTRLGGVILAIANVIKFALARDAAALYTIAIIGSVSFIALAVYMKFFASDVTKAMKKII